MPDFTTPLRTVLHRGRLLPNMPNPIWMVNVAVPVDMRDRLAARRIHHRQALYEIIEDALDCLEDAEHSSTAIFVGAIENPVEA